MIPRRATKIPPPRNAVVGGLSELEDDHRAEHQPSTTSTRSSSRRRSPNPSAPRIERSPANVD